jgi:hypothetical protein
LALPALCWDNILQAVCLRGRRETRDHGKMEHCNNDQESLGVTARGLDI